MKMTKQERVKAFQMMGDWCDYYENRILHLNKIQKEFAIAKEENTNVNYDYHLLDCIRRVFEMERDLRIMVRMRFYLAKAICQQNVSRQNELVAEFFQARKSYAPKWDDIDICTADITTYLQSTTGA
jgi:hypothetical protein